MSITNLARRHGRNCILVGLTREDVDQLIAGSVVFLEAKRGTTLPDIAIFAGETKKDLEDHLKEMEKPNGESQ